MKNIRILLLLGVFITLSIANLKADDKKARKKNQSFNSNAVNQKLKNLLSHSEFASENNIQGEYVILYNINKNMKICITEIKGENEKMKKDIYNHLNGKKVSVSQPSESHLRILKVNFTLL